jgi:hypothetical protein
MIFHVPHSLKEFLASILTLLKQIHPIKKENKLYHRLDYRGFHFKFTEELVQDMEAVYGMSPEELVGTLIDRRLDEETLDPYKLPVKDDTFEFYATPVFLLNGQVSFNIKKFRLGDF